MEQEDSQMSVFESDIVEFTASLESGAGALVWVHVFAYDGLKRDQINTVLSSKQYKFWAYEQSDESLMNYAGKRGSQSASLRYDS